MDQGLNYSAETLRTLESSTLLQKKRFTGVKTVLVVLSSRSMTFDMEGLRQHILGAYPNAVVFFTSVSGIPVGVTAPQSVDLILDFTPPGARQGFLHPFQLRRRSRYIVGRHAGLLRKYIYNRVYQDAKMDPVQDYHKREFIAQSQVLELAGIGITPQSSCGPDLSKTIALES